MDAIWVSIKDIYSFLNHNGFPVPFICLIIILIIVGRGQYNWSIREKYYCDLLLNLGNWKDSLLERMDYYQYPGSEYEDSDIGKIPGFVQLQSTGGKALKAIKESRNLTALFLSEKSSLVLNELLTEHWVIAEHKAMNGSEYLDLTYKIVANAYTVILSDAKKDLNRGKYAIFIQNIRTGIKE
jgi:hypothetical protein